MIERLEGGIEAAEVVADGLRGINVGRRAVLSGDVFQTNSFAMKDLITIRKGMHER
jgi:hypothetical protein